MINLNTDFVKKQAELSQTKLEQTFRAKSNKHFLNLDECAKNLIENSEQPTDNTLPVTLEAIANLEKLPKPADVCGVDLKTLYQMLAQLSAGFPVDELEDGPTKEFLKQCYSVRHILCIVTQYFVLCCKKCSWRIYFHYRN